MATEQRLPDWVERLRPATKEEIERAKEYARRARFNETNRHEPAEPIEITRKQAANEDYVIGVAV